MKNILIKNVMTPISDYASIREDQTLYDVFQILEVVDGAETRLHRDLVVFDDAGELKGKVTMLDIFRALEPNYQKLNVDYTGTTLTKERVLETIRDFELWMEPLKDLCERSNGIKISQVMHIPEKHEFVQEEESLEKALHQYVMGIHQPLIVKNGDRVTGILRFEDLYGVVKEQMLACKV